MRKIISSIETIQDRYSPLTNLLLQNARRLMEAASYSANPPIEDSIYLMEVEVNGVLFDLDDKFKSMIQKLDELAEPCEHCLRYLCICPGIDQEIERNLDEQEKEDG